MKDGCRRWLASLIKRDLPMGSSPKLTQRSQHAYVSHEFSKDAWTDVGRTFSP